MNKEKLGLMIHQGLAFSPFFIEVPKHKHLFWPGCSLLKLDPEILEETLEALKSELEDVGMVSLCCASPTRSIFPEKLEKRREKLKAYLKDTGVETIYTACPNCLKDLRSFLEVEVQMIWPVLHRAIKRKPQREEKQGLYNIQDPCPLREERESHEAIRGILTHLGYTYVDVEASKDKTICCGEVEMLAIRDKEKSKALIETSLKRFSHPVIGYCEGCVSRFKSKGYDSIHLLEMIFSESSSRSYANRLKNKKRCR